MDCFVKGLLILLKLFMRLNLQKNRREFYVSNFQLELNSLFCIVAHFHVSNSFDNDRVNFDSLPQISFYVFTVRLPNQLSRLVLLFAQVDDYMLFVLLLKLLLRLLRCRLSLSLGLLLRLITTCSQIEQVNGGVGFGYIAADLVTIILITLC